MADTLSQQYRSRAKICRTTAEFLLNPKSRDWMLEVAVEYERKAKQAEADEDETEKLETSH
jgi:hypothetical protein